MSRPLHPLRSSLLGLLFAAWCAAPAWAQAKGEAKEDLFDRMMKSTAFIAVPLPGTTLISTGSGSLILNTSQHKLILTNYHVVGKSETAKIMFPVKDPKSGDVVAERKKYLDNLDNPLYAAAGKVVAVDPVRDLALIDVQAPRLPVGVQVIALAEKAPKPGTTVHTLGNPGAGGMWSYTRGVVKSVHDREMRVRARNELMSLKFRAIEADNTINSGDSGGPLVNDKGELVGVTQGAIVGQPGQEVRGISIFIAVEEVRSVLGQNKIALPKPPAGGGATKSQVTSAEESPPKEKEKPKPPDPKEQAERNEKAAAVKLKRAQVFMTSGQTEDAREYLQDIIDKYPDTKAAGEAKELLKKTKK